MSNLAIVTGGSRGIGLAVADRLASLGWDIHLVSANRKNLDRAETLLKSRYSQILVSSSAIDFSDLDQIRKMDAPDGWDLLVNNAGAKVLEDAPRTAQGLEWHLGVNQIAPFALTMRLLSSANPQARVTTVSSIVARKARLSQLRATDLSVGELYARSKFMNLTWAIELQKRLRESSNPVLQTITSSAAHPGFTRASKYGRAYVRPAEYLLAQSTAKGALPILDSALEPLDRDDPFYYRGPRFFELWGESGEAQVPQEALDVETRNVVWSLSEELSGVTTEFLV